MAEFRIKGGNLVPAAGHARAADTTQRLPALHRARDAIARDGPCHLRAKAGSMATRPVSPRNGIDRWTV